MKSLVGVVLATLLVPGIAAAAESGASFYSWGGLYIGVNGGYGSGDVGLSNVIMNGRAETYGAGLGPSGGLAGGQLGYNFQSGNVVFGVETDLQWSDMSETNALNDTVKVNYFGTVRGRIGYALDRLLPFVTAGLAYGEGEATLRKSGVVVTDQQMHTGWTVGAGLEAAIDEHLSVKAEYLYIDFGSQGYNWVRNANAISADGSVTANVFRVGINYRF